METVANTLYAEGTARPDTKELLQLAKNHELENITESMDNQPSVQEDYFTTTDGHQWLHWWLEIPTTEDTTSRKRITLEEHYAFGVVDNHILFLSSIRTNYDETAAIVELLKETAATVETATAPIDLNALRKEILGN